MKIRFTRGFLSCMMALALLTAAVPTAYARETKKQENAVSDALHMGVLADPHYFSAKQAGGYNEAFLEANARRTNSLWMESVGMLESALAAFAAYAKKNGTKYLLIPGDMTWNGELAGHKSIAARLERFEKETGVQVAVVPGNHDINNKNALDFSGGKRAQALSATPAQFREIYRNLGYDLLNMTQFKPKEGKLGGGLSYAADLAGGYRLIALDSCKYSQDQNEKGDMQSTGGMLSDELLQWAVAQCKAAVKARKVPIGLIHHSLIPHHGLQLAMRRLLVDNARRVRTELANAGMHFVFSGHIHTSEIADYRAFGGAVFYDIATSSLADFPPTIREVTVSGNISSAITMIVKTHPVDDVKPVVVNGKQYESPVAPKIFDIMYHGEGVISFAQTMLYEVLEGVLGGRLVGIADRTALKILGYEVSQQNSLRASRRFKGNTLADLIDEAIFYGFARETDVGDNEFVQDVLQALDQSRFGSPLAAFLRTMFYDMNEVPDSDATLRITR